MPDFSWTLAQKATGLQAEFDRAYKAQTGMVKPFLIDMLENTLFELKIEPMWITLAVNPPAVDNLGIPEKPQE